MAEPLYYYSHKEKVLLKDTYPYFYSKLIDYLSSLPKEWFFEECYNPDLDGSRFSIILHDGGTNHLSVNAYKQTSTYSFSIIKQY